MDSKVRRHFKKVDPVYFEVISKYDDLEIGTSLAPKEYFVALCREILGQQLSGKVADVIYNRFKLLFPKQQITAKSLLKLSHEQLRATGMSNSKVKFLQDLAQKVESKELSLADLASLDDEGVIKELTKVKGIGPWTAEMFLIFALGREDVFSFGDLGLNNALKKIYDIKTGTKEEIELIVAKWSPYRSYACRILWKSLDNR